MRIVRYASGQQDKRKKDRQTERLGVTLITMLRTYGM